VGRWALGLLRQSAVFVIDRQGLIVYAQVVNNPKAVLKLEKVKGALQATTSGSFGGM
jgi:sensor domain CHASE-containing protein